ASPFDFVKQKGVSSPPLQRRLLAHSALLVLGLARQRARTSVASVPLKASPFDCVKQDGVEEPDSVWPTGEGSLEVTHPRGSVATCRGESARFMAGPPTSLVSRTNPPGAAS